jgi:hypothetical protein
VLKVEGLRVGNDVNYATYMVRKNAHGGNDVPRRDQGSEPGVGKMGKY